MCCARLKRTAFVRRDNHEHITERTSCVPILFLISFYQNKQFSSGKTHFRRVANKRFRDVRCPTRQTFA